MADRNAIHGMTTRPDARLSRRSLVAAGALLAAMGPMGAARAQRPVPVPACSPNRPACQCFLRGTRLLTPDGEIAIEDLKIGDAVTVHDGETRTIRWIGMRSISRVGGWRGDDLPIQISKGALGANTPHRDLYVTRAHLLYLDGVLIPASDLINGRTISVVTPETDALEYFHVELGTHDVVIAEGASCESLRNADEAWRNFDNADAYAALYGDLPPMHMTPYAPIALFNGRRSQFKSRMRSAIAPVIDIRRPLDIVRDNIEARALLSKAA